MHRWSLTLFLTASALGAGLLASRGGALSSGASSTGGASGTTALSWGGGTTRGWGSTAGRAEHLGVPKDALGDTDGCLTVQLELDTPALPDPSAWTTDNSFHETTAKPSPYRYALATVRAEATCPSSHAPLDLAVVLDLSGSMDTPEKLPPAKQAILSLAEALPADARVSLTTFSDDSARAWELDRPTPAFASLVRGLRPHGSTNLEAGLRTGQSTLGDRPEAVQRLLLLTDGEANVGARTLAEGLGAALSRRPDITVTTIGLGLDYNETLLTGLAEAGHGAYHYATDGRALASVYREELDAASRLVARDVRLRLEVPEGMKVLQAWGTREAVSASSASASLGDLSVGDTRRVLLKLEVVDAARVPLDTVAAATVEYQRVGQAEETMLWDTVGAESTGDLAMLTRRDPAVAAQQLRLEGATVLEEARKTYASGDKAGGDRMVRQQLDALSALGYVDAGYEQEKSELNTVLAAPTAAAAQKQSSEAWYDNNRR